MFRVRSLLLVILALGLAACANQYRYEPNKPVPKAQSISLPADMNKSDVVDYYRVPPASASQSSAQPSLIPPTVTQ